MTDPNHPKLRHGTSAPVKSGTPPEAPTAATGGTGATGKVVHDDHGSAVWDWLKQTGRIAIESTSRLLRKLEAPDLKVEDTHDKELRIMREPGSGGGYDPYNQTTKPTTSRRK